MLPDADVEELFDPLRLPRKEVTSESWIKFFGTLIISIADMFVDLFAPSDGPYIVGGEVKGETCDYQSHPRRTRIRQATTSPKL